VTQSLDTATFNIISHGLHAIAQEMGEKLVRSAYSTIIREARDCSTALLDRRGRVVAQAQFCPIHMNSFGKVFEAFAARYDLGAIRPEESLITNDPYSGAQHLNDIIIFSPIFHAGSVVAFAASLGHHIDVGGGAAGPNAQALDVYSEGLRIPPLKFSRERDMGEGMLEQFIRINVRAPDQVAGDLHAQLAANHTGEVRFLEMLDRFGEATVLEAVEKLQSYSEQLTRQAIASIPDGEYVAEDFVDDNGFTDEPLRVAVRVVIKGDTLSVDLAGSSPQTKGIVNCPLASTISAVYGAFAVVLGSGKIPVNDGLYRPISDVRAPLGSFLNPDQPVAVRARNSACHRIYNAIMLAMADAAPDRVLTSGHDTTNAIGMGHMGSDRYRVYMEVVGGGWGACAAGDGADVVDGYVGNCSNVPVESLEQDYPFMRIEEYALRTDSGGAGESRGGLGVRRVYRILDDGVTFNCYSDRFRIAPWGLFGGQPGQPSRFTIERGEETIHLDSKTNAALRRGDRLVIETAGAGGYGDPARRSPERVERDLRGGLISETMAREAFGYGS
jgi:N-methylhydantoinase B